MTYDNKIMIILGGFLSVEQALMSFPVTSFFRYFMNIRYLKMEKAVSYVYILVNRHKNVIYVGSTEDLKKRIYFHKKRLIPGFTKKYNVNILVYFEEFEAPQQSLIREKQIKKYRREKKIALIQNTNPDWNDLYDSL